MAYGINTTSPVDTQDALLLTPKYDLNKARRQPSSSVFFRAITNSRQDVIEQDLDKLCNRICVFTEPPETFNLGAAITAVDYFDEAMVKATSRSGQA
ncbi:hypothetical protein F5Y09DRAFT_338821 [Xylaria sp. FL1042]|nr:hypothetical protein F5Y09DRAFT_338821 [Xylaria sp. FL1042]